MNDGPAPIFPECPPHDAIIIDPCFEPSLPPPHARVPLCSESRRARDSGGNTNAHDMRPVCEYVLLHSGCLSCATRSSVLDSTENFVVISQKFMSRNANASA